MNSAFILFSSLLVLFCIGNTPGFVDATDSKSSILELDVMLQVIGSRCKYDTKYEECYPKIYDGIGPKKECDSELIKIIIELILKLKLLVNIVVQVSVSLINNIELKVLLKVLLLLGLKGKLATIINLTVNKNLLECTELLGVSLGSEPLSVELLN